MVIKLTTYSINSESFNTQYKIACESAGEKYNKTKFNKVKNDLKSMYIIVNKESLNQQRKGRIGEQTSSEDKFFMTCNPQKLKLLVFNYERDMYYASRGLNRYPE